MLAEEGGERTLLRTSLVTSVGIRHIGLLDALQGANLRVRHRPSHSRNSNARFILDRAHHRGLMYSRETVEDWARGPGLSPIRGDRGDEGGSSTKGQP